MVWGLHYRLFTFACLYFCVTDSISPVLSRYCDLILLSYVPDANVDISPIASGPTAE